MIDDSNLVKICIDLEDLLKPFAEREYDLFETYNRRMGSGCRFTRTAAKLIIVEVIHAEGKEAREARVAIRQRGYAIPGEL